MAAGLEERGVPVEHAPLQRWVVTDSPQLEAAFHRRPRPVWGSGRRDEPSSKRNGQWEYRDGAGDTPGQRIACLRTAHRDEQAVKQGGTTAIRHQGVLEKSTSDGSAAHKAASTSSNTAHGTAIALRQLPEWQNKVEQAHRAVKRVPRPLRGCKSFDAAPCP